MINKTCKACSQPMNGGVYRKPNVCPHCLTLQDESRAPDNKHLNAHKPTPALSASALADNYQPLAAAAYAVQELDMEEVTQELDVLSEIQAAAKAEVLEQKAVEQQQSVSEEVTDQQELEPEQNVVEEVEPEVTEVEQQDVTIERAEERREPVHFDNLETRPNDNESLDIALDLGDVNDVLMVTRQVVVQDTAARNEVLNQQQIQAKKEKEASEKQAAPDVDDAPVLLEEVAIEDEPAALAEQGEVSQLEDALKPQDVFKPQEVIQEPKDDDLMVFLDEAEEASEAVLVEQVSAPIVQEELASETQEDLAVCAEVKVSAPKTVESDGAEYETIVLTTETVTNMEIEKRIDMVSAECVFGTDMLKSQFDNKQDITHPEYSASPNVLKDARKTVLDEIKKEAFLLGANTVVDVKLDYSEISRGASPMMMIVATGTAVKAA